MPLPRYSLPWTSDLPDDPVRARRVTLLRGAAQVLLVAVLAAVCAQVQVQVARNIADGERTDRQYLKAVEQWRLAPTEDNRKAALAAAEKVRQVKRHKGAILRWSQAVRQFWRGQNIYQAPPGFGQADPLTGALPPGAGSPIAMHLDGGAPTLPARPEPALGAAPNDLRRQEVYLHPNMPFVVVLLTPLAYLPMPIMAAAVNVLKVIAFFLAILAAAGVANDGRRRMGDWVMGLAVLFALPLVISDIQHGNTNTFVLAAIAGHLWLYRRGHDMPAGALLALAICFKLTPALFALYWLWQRNWRLLEGLAVALAVMVVLVPLTVIGPAQYVAMMGAWLDNIIVPGLLKDSPYPMHINQSLPGVLTRLLRPANIYWNPEDDVAADQVRFVNLVALSAPAFRTLLTGLKMAVLALMAWGIGWKRLPRDDGRRALHYGLVLCAMLILNQRTWDHHGAILLPAYAAAWYALAYGRVGRRWRRLGLVLMLASALPLFGMSGSLFTALAGGRAGRELADVIEAYGPTLLHFVLLFAVCLILLRQLRRAGPDAYESFRQQV